MGLKMLEKFHVSQKDIVYINEEKLRSVTKQILMTQEIPEKDLKKDLVQDLQYLSTDSQGNTYLIKAKTGVLDEENPDIIYLKNVNALISFDQNKEIIIRSDKATYNNDNFDTDFYNNVSLDYDYHHLTCENIQVKFSENYAMLSGNLVYSNLLTKLYADQMEVDLISRKTKTTMTNYKDKVTIIYKDYGTN